MAEVPQNQEQQRSPSQPVGYLFSRAGLLGLLAGLLLAAWYHQVVIVVLLGLLLSSASLARLWSRFSLSRVTCHRQVSERRVFPGESIELRLRLVNRKLLPLPWVQVDDEIPLRLSSDAQLAAGSRPGTGLLRKSLAVLWYTGASWKQDLRCNRRGYYQLGPLTLTSGDIFGLFTRSVTEPHIDHVIVYPKIYPIDHLGIPSLHPLGETVSEQRIFEDPVRIVGVREYTPRDSRRHIHWKATARRQELQVKVFEPTTTLKVAIFLAFDSNSAAEDEEGFELCISTAASVASYLTERRSAVGLFVNSRLADSRQPAMLPPGTGTGQLIEVLEALAKVSPTASGPFEEFLQVERRALPYGTGLVFVLHRPSPSLVALLTSLREKGPKMLVLQVGRAKEGDGAGEAYWHHITRPEDMGAAV